MRNAILISILALFALVLISFAALLNSPKLQRMAYASWVAPTLLDFGVSTDFESFRYNNRGVVIESITVFINDSAVSHIQGLRLNELNWTRNELRFGSIGADSIFLDARDTTELSRWYKALPTSNGTATTLVTFNEFDLPNAVVAVDGIDLIHIAVKGSEMSVVPEFTADSLHMALGLDSLQAQLKVHDLSFNSDAVVDLDLQTNIGANLEGKLTLGNNVINANIEGVITPALRRWGLDSLAAEVLMGTSFSAVIESSWPEVQATYNTVNEYFNLFGELRSSSTGYETNGQVKLAPALYELLPLVEETSELKAMLPDIIGYELAFDDFTDLDFSVTARANQNQLKLYAPSLNHVAKIELNAPNLPLGPVFGGSIKAALKPSLSSLLNGQAIQVVGLAPKLHFQDHDVRGFSFDFHHGTQDSLWWSCLDSLMDVQGQLTYAKDIYKGRAEINALGLMLLDPLDTGQVISGSLAFQVSNALQGSVVLKDVLLQRPMDVVFINELNLSHIYKDAFRSIQVNSEVLSGSLEGNYGFNDLLPIGDIILSDLIGQSHKQNLKGSTLSLNADIGNINWLSQLFHLDLSLPEGGTVSGSYSSMDKTWAVQGYVPVIEQRSQKIEDLRINTKATNNLIYGTLSIEDGQFPGIHLAQSSIVWKPIDQQRAQVHLVRKDSLPGSLDATITYEDLSYQIVEGLISLGKDSINIERGGPIYWDGSTIVFDTIKMTGTQGKLNLGGVLGGGHSESLWLTWQEGNADVFNYFYRDPNLNLSGPIAVQLEVPSLVAGFDLRGFMQSPGLTINGWDYGKLNLSANWDGSRSDLFLNAYLKHGKSDARINGHYDAVIDDLDFTLSTNALAIQPFQTYLEDVLEPINGDLSGGVLLFGPLSDWQLDGEFSLGNTSFGIPIIGGQLVAEKGIDFSVNEQRILLDTSFWKDEKYGTEAMLWGSMPHNRFQDLALDLKLMTDSLYAMKLERQYDSYFYGTGIAGGSMELDGPLEQLHLGLSLETKAGTSIKIPLDNPTSVETPSFIQFVDNNTTSKKTDSTKTYEYFTTDIDVQVNPDAQLELILDEVLGDIIKARGTGAMQMKILEDESFELYGLYTVESGDYLFTLQGIINKQFELLPGGTILWSGDLYEAELNLKAKYSLSTSLNGLVSNPNYNNANVDVDLIVELTGPLLSPTIGFTIELPNSPSSYQQELERRILTADAMNYQAFSLLMLGDFYRQNLAVQEGINLGESLSRSTSEMLVSQFGSWITAGLGTYVDVELDYSSGNNPYNTLINSGDEIRLGVSKDFLDGRLRINSSVDVPLAQDGSSTLLLGDTQIEYALRKDGRTILKAFNRSNRNDPLLQSAGPYTQGVGIQFRKDFESLKKD